MQLIHFRSPLALTLFTSPGEACEEPSKGEETYNIRRQQVKQDGIPRVAVLTDDNPGALAVVGTNADGHRAPW